METHLLLKVLGGFCVLACSAIIKTLAVFESLPTTSGRRNGTSTAINTATFVCRHDAPPLVHHVSTPYIFHLNPLKFHLVRPKGLEPLTVCLRGNCSAS